MPRRVLQHELETRSRTRFEAALPSVWVARALSPDYGLDYEVEVFAEVGSHTGDSFYVQLKGRGGPDVGKALRLWFPHEVADYYRRQGLPVLIVGYHGPTETLFARWFHSFDPHYGGHHEKGVTFVLDPTRDLWNDSTPARLASEVRAFRRWRSAKLTLPVTFSIESEGMLHGVLASEVLLRLRVLADGAVDIIRLGPEPSTKHPVIRLSDEQITVDFQGVASATSHRTGYNLEAARTRYPFDILVTVALAFAQIGQVNAAARLIRAFGPESSLIDAPEIVFRAVGWFVQSHRVLDALRMAEKIRSRDDLEEPVAQIIFSAALAQASAMSSEEIEDVRRYLGELAQRADEEGDPPEASVAHYNLGNWLKANELWNEAIVHYWRASEWDPAYLTRSYFLREFAGVLFEMGHFQHSSDFYQCARESGEDVEPLLADALMHGGKYRKAVEMFEAHFERKTDPAPWWRLKSWALRGAMTLVGVDEQVRDAEAATEIAAAMPSALKDEDVERYSEQALGLDLLCPLAWFNIGVLASKRGDQEGALGAFVLAGLLEPSDTEAWCNSTLLALATESGHPLFQPIVETAYISLGHSFVTWVSQHLVDREGEFPVGEVLAAIEGTVRHIHKQRPGFELRFLLDENRYESFHIQPPFDVWSTDEEET